MPDLQEFRLLLTAKWAGSYRDPTFGFGWRLHRIWGVAWYRDRLGEERRLREAIEHGIARATQRVAPDLARPIPVVPNRVVIELSDQPNWTEAYKPGRIKVGSSFGEYHMYDPYAGRELERLIQEVVGIEGPVAQEVVITRIREAWGYGRAGARMRDAFRAAVRGLVRRQQISQVGEFLATLAANTTRVRVPSPSDPRTERTIDQVPPSELELALLRLVEEARSVPPDELTRRAAQLFGWGRRGSEIAIGLESAVRRLLRNGGLVRNEGLLQRGETDGPAV